MSGPAIPRQDLTESDRSGMIGVMTEAELGWLLAYITGRAPELFDAAVAARPASGGTTFEDELWDRVDAKLAEEDAGLPDAYCSACSVRIGIFHGHGDGWHHYRGEGTVENPNELLELDHEPVVAWRYPDGTEGGTYCPGTRASEAMTSRTHRSARLPGSLPGAREP